MSREWEPGDVAMVRNEHNVWNAAICALSAPRGTVWRYGVSDSWMPLTADARRLVVIDPEDREQVERLSDAYEDRRPESSDLVGHMQTALREFANPTPPKPDEPLGLGAVVECEHRVYEWARAVRIGNGFAPWFYTDSSGNGGSRAWNDLPVVRVLSPGYTEDGAS